MSNIVIMDFMAEWCGPCKMQDPIIEELKKIFGDKVEFKKMDVDENGKLADKYEIRAVPTLIIEKDGEVIKRYVGVTNKRILEKDIKDALEPKKESGKQETDEGQDEEQEE